MGRARFLVSNFTAGELSPRLKVRSDLQRFFAGCERNENFQILIEGGMALRMGTLANGRTPGDGRAVLVGFSRSAFDSLMLEFTAGRMRVWKPDYTLATVAGGAIYELATPWTAEDLPWLAFTQAATPDLLVTHRGGASPVQALTRLADNDWTLADYEIQNGPFLPLASPAVTLSASATTGSVTLSASAAAFNAAQVGGVLRIRENAGNPPVNRWEAGKSIATNDLRLNGGRVYQAAGSGTSGSTPPIHWEGTVSDGAIGWTFLHDGAGVARITAVASATSASATVLSTLPSVAGTTFWQEGAFSSARGWPRAACQHQERIWLGGTQSQPDTLWGSVSSGYFDTGADFKPGLGTGLVVDSDAVTRTLTGGQVRPIQHLVSAGALYVFTPKTVEVVTGPSDREPITPAGAAAISRPGLGSSPWITPVKGASDILYASFSGQRILAMPWNDAGGSDGGVRDLTLLASHLGKAAPFVQLALCEDPDPTLFALTSAGQLFAMAYSPDQQVAGWWRLVPGGNATIDAIACLQRPDGRDQLWLQVTRTVAGQTRRTIEHLPGLQAPNAPRDLAARLDSGVFWDVWNADPARTVSVPAALRGASFTVTASAAVFAGVTAGRELWLRRDDASGDLCTTLGPARLRIDTVVSATEVTATALSDVPAALAGPQVQWGLALTSLAGLGVHAGATLDVFADFEDLGTFAVTSGGTLGGLPRPTCRGFAGYRLSGLYRLLPLDVAGDIGSTFGASVRADQLTAIALEGVTLEAGPRGRPRDTIRLSSPSDLLSAPPRPQEAVRKIPLSGDGRERIDVELHAPGPWPCELGGLSLRVIADG
jgi:hypothetical protein